MRGTEPLRRCGPVDLILEMSRGLTLRSTHSPHSPPGIPSTPAAVMGTLPGLEHHHMHSVCWEDSKFKIWPHLRDSFELFRAPTRSWS